MEWIVTLATGLAVFVLLLPLIALLGTIFILVPLAHLVPPPAMVARTSFDCPFSKRRVSVAFLASPSTEEPADVLSCSIFADGRGIRCKKGCLRLAHTRWMPSPIVPRFALFAGGEALR